MKNRTLLLVAALLWLAAIPAGAQMNRLVQVKIHTTNDLNLRSQVIGALEIDHFIEDGDEAIVCELSEAAFLKLQTYPIKYEVLKRDVGEWLRQENSRYDAAVRAGIDVNTPSRVAFSQSGITIDDIITTPSAFELKNTFGGYYSFAEMNTAMNELVANYPTLAQKISLGKSRENRDIWLIKISDNVTTDELNEPEVLFIGLQHAREAITGASMIFFMQYLCESYLTDPRIKDLVDNREIYIIPCLNPDGWEHNRTNGGVGGDWRKNRRNNGNNIYGVDLNRNWGVDWANCSSPINGSPSSCGSGSNSAATYYGPSVFSEPETRAVRDFVYTKHIVAAIDQHAYGPYYSLPFGRPSLHPGADSLTLADQQFYTRIPALMGMYNGMRAGNSFQSVGYEVAGGVKDWFLKGDIGTGTKGKIYGLTGEGSAGGGTGGSMGNFWAPKSQIINLCKGMVFQNLQMTYAAGSYVDIQDVDDLNVTALSGNFNFRVTRIGLQDAPVTVSLIPLENVQSAGSPVVISSMPNYYDVVNNSISYNLFPSLSSGQRIRFVWRVQTGGYTYYDTVTKFFDAQELYVDDMEGNINDNWSVSGGGWNYSTDDAFQGSRALTESPGGNYTNNSTRRVQYNNSMNLTGATSAFLSFWTKHRSENFRDKLQVQVSANNGPWTAIRGNLTIQEPGTFDGSTLDGEPALTGWRDLWTRATFDLSDYLDVTNLRLRFEFTSSGSSTFFYNVDDGFYIDNLQIFKTNAELINLPVSFLYLKGNLLSNNTVKINWDAQVDGQHDYFEVEKSADGAHFTAIGKVYGPAPYHFIDPSPFNGNNYYRIKNYEKDGSVSYSRVINVPYLAQAKVTIFPNPLEKADDLTIKLEANYHESLLVQVNDAQGRVIYRRAITEWPASGTITIPAAQWKPQVYVVKISNSKGSFITVQKVIKH